MLWYMPSTQRQVDRPQAGGVPACGEMSRSLRGNEPIPSVAGPLASKKREQKREQKKTEIFGPFLGRSGVPGGPGGSRFGAPGWSGGTGSPPPHPPGFWKTAQKSR